MLKTLKVEKYKKQNVEGTIIKKNRNMLKVPKFHVPNKSDNELYTFLYNII